MKCHLLVVLERKIKMLRLLLSMHKVKYYRQRHNNFLRMTHLYYNHVPNISDKSGALCRVQNKQGL